MTSKIMHKGQPVDVDNIPQSQLDNYTKEQLQEIARYAMQRHDMRLLKVRWDILDEKSTKQTLKRIIQRCNNWGTKP